MTPRSMEAFSADTVDRDGLRDWPLRRREVGWLVAMYLVITGAGTAVGFFLTEVLVPATFVGDVDLSLARWLEAHRTPTFDVLTNFGSGFADTISVVLASFVLVALLLGSWRRWGEVLLLVTALGLEVTTFVSMTHIVGRDRPPIEKLDPAPPTSSFPSGHTAAAVALWFGLALILAYHYRHVLARAIFYGLAISMVVAVAASRMYRGMHHLSDVVAGAILGAVCLAVAVWIVGEGVVRARPPAEDAAAPGERAPATVAA